MEERKKQIPEGYMEDARGHLVPESMVKDIDKIRDELVKGLVAKAKDVKAMLQVFKNAAFEEIEQFIELSASEYDTSLGGNKGNVTLMSFDGRYRVMRAVAESFVFDERLQVAKDLIDQCLNEWTASSGPELKALVNDAFSVDRAGNVNAKRILSLRKFNIEDERWLRAMAAINDSLTVAGSREYVRIYERVQDTDRWEQIPLDVAGV
ncbi:MAG: sulfate transporter [Desulfobulbaceae bacterium BRH_c16a]|nr:MAG: sulfate transporter [Desulfobulbaceae bacterium BRH_c16a]